jgi:hypothetical protein
VQAEGGFGSRHIFVGCFASAIECGPQRLTNKNTTRPAWTLFQKTPFQINLELLELDDTLGTYSSHLKKLITFFTIEIITKKRL